MSYDKVLVYRAGTVPYIVEDGQVIMMFMRPSNELYGGNQFQLCKGRVEEGEDMQTAAIREAKEELGLFVGNVLLIEEVGTFMGRTTVFLAKIKNRDMFGLPDEETADTTWMTLEQFMADGRDLHKPVVQAVYRQICRIEQLDI